MALVVEDCFVASISNLLLSIYKTAKPGKVILSGLLLLIKNAMLQNLLGRSVFDTKAIGYSLVGDLATNHIQAFQQ